jgi:tetratricopeptide (TPR) repeat protein
LQREGIIKPWHDRQITGGREWAGEIDKNLEAADIILLLVSPDFLASDYCNDIEMCRALERHAEGKARVIPIILRPADWQTASFGKLQCLPKRAQAVTEWRSKDKAFLDIARGIRRAANELRGYTLPGLAPFITLRGRPRRWVAVGLVLLLAGVVIGGWPSQQYLARGNQFLDIGRYAEARVAFQSAQRFNPLSPAAALGIEKTTLVDMKRDLVRFEQQARDLYKKAPHDPHVNMFMGDLTLRLGERKEAIRFYEKALQLRPDLAETHFALGVLHDQEGNRDEAQRQYTKAIEISPATPKYRNNLAYVLFREGNYDEAIKHYGMNDHYPLSALEIGKIYWVTGNVAQARDHQRQAIEWLENEKIAMEPQNQGPWYFEIGNEAVALQDLAEKRCYAYYALSVSSYLLEEEANAEARHKEALSVCPTGESVLKDVIRYDLARTAEANNKYAARITAYRERFLGE